MTVNNTIEIYVHLLEEGISTLRPTQALSLGNDLYQLLPTSDYDPEDEIWECLPGSIVKAVPHKDFEKNPLTLAVSSDSA